MLVAVGAFDPVDVMRALRVRKGRVHLLHIEAAEPGWSVSRITTELEND